MPRSVEKRAPTPPARRAAGRAQGSKSVSCRRASAPATTGDRRRGAPARAPGRATSHRAPAPPPRARRGSSGRTRGASAPAGETFRPSRRCLSRSTRTSLEAGAAPAARLTSCTMLQWSPTAAAAAAGPHDSSDHYYHPRGTALAPDDRIDVRRVEGVAHHVLQVCRRLKSDSATASACRGSAATRNPPRTQPKPPGCCLPRPCPEESSFPSSARPTWFDLRFKN